MEKLSARAREEARKPRRGLTLKALIDTRRRKLEGALESNEILYNITKLLEFSTTRATATTTTPILFTSTA